MQFKHLDIVQLKTVSLKTTKLVKQLQVGKIIQNAEDPFISIPEFILSHKRNQPQLLLNADSSEIKPKMDMRYLYNVVVKHPSTK